MSVPSADQMRRWCGSTLLRTRAHVARVRPPPRGSQIPIGDALASPAHIDSGAHLARWVIDSQVRGRSEFALNHQVTFTQRDRASAPVPLETGPSTVARYRSTVPP